MSLINRIIIGTWSLSGDFGKIPNQEVENILYHTIKSGFIEFDTAPNYGAGEIDKILSKVISNSNQKIKINTKCGNSPNGIKSFKIEDMIKTVEHSLKLFGSINILFLHNPREEIVEWPKIINFLNDLKSQNLIKSTGISLARNYYFDDNLLNQFDFIQDEINLLNFISLEKLKKIKSKIIARSPLASGVLSGNLNEHRVFEKNDYRSSWLKGERLKNILYQVKKFERVSNMKLADLAKSFIFSQSNVDKVIFGIKSKTHIDQLVTDIENIPFIKKDTLESIIELSKINYGLDFQKKGY